MNSRLQRGGWQLKAQPDYPGMTEKGMSPWNELSIAIAVFLISLILDYGALFYFGNPIHLVIVFIAIMEAIIFSALIVHFLVVMIKGLRIEGEYFILPHPGLYALVKGGPRTIRFKDIDVASLNGWPEGWWTPTESRETDYGVGALAAALASLGRRLAHGRKDMP